MKMTQRQLCGAGRNRAAFSLMEVLLAVFILGIGLIMVATIFPVGADWTRQSTEDTVAQTVAQNAVTIVQNYYSPSSGKGTTAGTLDGVGNTLQALPFFTSIPVSERCYQFGNSQPFPARKPEACTYYWTALARRQPGQSGGNSARFDLYILVFRKGAANQIFTPPTSGPSEVAGVRDLTDPVNPAMDFRLEPTLLTAQYQEGASPVGQTSPVNGAIPEIGFIAIGRQSGTVFRQGVDLLTTPGSAKAVARPAIIKTPAFEDVIYAMPADGTSASPLVYVYQTTVSF